MIEMIVEHQDRPHHIGRATGQITMTRSSDMGMSVDYSDSTPWVSFGVFVVGKHAMLSYEWGTQTLVSKVRQSLTKQGVTWWANCGATFHHFFNLVCLPMTIRALKMPAVLACSWQDIDGGMGADVSCNRNFCLYLCRSIVVLSCLARGSSR